MLDIYLHVQQDVWAFDAAYITIGSMLWALQVGVYISIVVLYMKLRCILSLRPQRSSESQ